MTALRRHVPTFFLYGEFEKSGLPFHIETLETRSRPANWLIAPHSHDSLHQIFCITQGYGEMNAEGRNWLYQAPALMIVPAGSIHGFRHEPETEGFVMTISESYLNDVTMRVPELRSIFTVNTTLNIAREKFAKLEFGEISKKMAAIFTANEKLQDIFLEANLLLLLAGIWKISDIPSASGNSPRLSLVNRFKMELEQRFREGLSVSEYANILGVTETRLRAACREVTHNTPVGLMHDKLIREAKNLLHYTDLSISEISYEIGLEDPAYFSRFFKEKSGETPSVFRDRIRAKRAG